MGGEAAILVSGVHKGFALPRTHASTLKERALRPFDREPAQRLEVLRGIDLEVGRGEFFGITGRNGSGKSTLLKLIAGVYAPDRGEIAVAGRLAPFIDLGVGFHPELPARENVILNAVLMGLSEDEARARCEGIVEYAGLARFGAMKLRNYSSGMRVRLGFAVLVHSDARVLLLDEVLSVGDAAFQRQCERAFEELIAQGRTIVLVTHSMSRIERFCKRALVLEAGLINAIGSPDLIADRYRELSVASSEVGPRGSSPGPPAIAPASPPISPATVPPLPDTELVAGGLTTVRGPQMVGNDLGRFWRMLKLMARTEFNIRYHGTVAGYAWTLITPLLIFGILYLVFTRIIRFGGSVESYPAVLLLDVMLFRFFTEATQGSVSSLVQREALVRKTQLPRLAVPMAVVVTAAIGLALNLIVVVGYLLSYGIEPRLTWLLLPVLVAALIVFTTAVSALLSALFVRFRDTAQIWSVATTALLYLTPVMFPIEVAPGGIRHALLFNPLAPILELGRVWVIDPNAPGPIEAAGSWIGIAGPAIVFVAICVLSYRIFSRETARAAEDL
ncbi:hypothetical protein BH10ACT11_BH10ACT11_12860 [soil metagenome]